MSSFFSFLVDNGDGSNTPLTLYAYSKYIEKNILLV